MSNPKEQHQQAKEREWLELELDAETIRDLEPPSDGVGDIAGGMGYTHMCPTPTCVTQACPTHGCNQCSQLCTLTL
jgi:hypothetical protein